MEQLATAAPSTRGTATPAGTTCASSSTTWTRRSRVLRDIPGVRVLGDRKEVAGDSPRVAGNRWTYFLTPWGLLMELVDRSRVADPPALVGPADWHRQPSQRQHQKGPVTMRIAGHTLGTPEQTVPEALALFAAAGLDAAEVIYQDGYRSGLPLRDRALRAGGRGGPPRTGVSRSSG